MKVDMILKREFAWDDAADVRARAAADVTARAANRMPELPELGGALGAAVGGTAGLTAAGLGWMPAMSAAAMFEVLALRRYEILNGALETQCKAQQARLDTSAAVGQLLDDLSACKDGTKNGDLTRLDGPVGNRGSIADRCQAFGIELPDPGEDGLFGKDEIQGAMDRCQRKLDQLTSNDNMQMTFLQRMFHGLDECVQSISNYGKSRHDTAQNTLGNIR